MHTDFKNLEGTWVTELFIALVCDVTMPTTMHKSTCIALVYKVTMHSCTP